MRMICIKYAYFGKRSMESHSRSPQDLCDLLKQPCHDPAKELLDFTASLEKILTEQPEQKINMVHPDSGLSLLHLASNQGKTLIVKMLIEKRVDVNELENENKFTALMCAARVGYHQIVSLLIEAKANVNLQNAKQDTAAHITIRANQYECLQLLLAASANIQLKNQHGYTPLHIATLRGHLKHLTLLIEAKAEIDSKDHKDNTSLMLAAESGNTVCASILIEQGADVNARNVERISVLTESILTRNLELVSVLLKKNILIDNPILLANFLENQSVKNPRVKQCQDILKKQDEIEKKLQPPKIPYDKEYIFLPFVLESCGPYSNCSADDKIQLLAERIPEVCALLSKLKPKAIWLIAWHEYGISDINHHSISNESRKNLKATMLKLSEQYPNLVILAGSVLVRKKMSSEALPTILSYYDRLDWVDKIEKKINNVCNHQIELNRNKISLLKDSNQEITVTANIAGVYFEGKETSHGKIAPYKENKGLPEPVVYQPGKGNNYSPLIKLTPDLVLGINICREASRVLDILKKFEMEEKQKVLFQCVVSNSIEFMLPALQAQFGAFYVDRRYDPLFILSRNYKNMNIHVEMYPINVMLPVKNLGNPIPPLYPVQFQIMDKIEEEKARSDDEQKAILDMLSRFTLFHLRHWDILEKEYHDYIDHVKQKLKSFSPDFQDQLISILDNNPRQLRFKKKSAREKMIEWWQKNVLDYKDYQQLFASLIQPFQHFLSQDRHPSKDKAQIELLLTIIRKLPYSSKWIKRNPFEIKRLSGILLEIRTFLGEVEESKCVPKMKPAS